MINPLKSRPFLAFLTVCLALAGLSALPSANLAAMTLPENFELETDQGEFDDDLFSIGFLALTLPGLTGSQAWLQALGSCSLQPSPVSPPPKPF